MAVAPAAVETAFQASSNTSEVMMQRLKADIPMKRFAVTDEIGGLVLFLCSEAYQFMTADPVDISGAGRWR